MVPTMYYNTSAIQKGDCSADWVGKNIFWYVVTSLGLIMYFPRHKPAWKDLKIGF